MPSDYAKAKEDEWRALVLFVFTTKADRLEAAMADLARETGIRPGYLRRKVDAVGFKREQGWDQETIVAAGQVQTLSAYIAHLRTKQTEKKKRLTWVVSASLADAIQNEFASPDQEEPLITRLVRVCGLRTSDDLWEFLNSWFAPLNDTELLHHAGEHIPKKRRRK
jgi:hypothetical protein